MKENSKHYIDGLNYLMEQTVIYIKEKGEQFFKELNLGITLEQLIAMDTISANVGICQTDLSRLMLKERSSTSRILNSLEKLEFVERKTATKNRRLVNELYITAQGEDFLSKNGEKLKKTFENVFDDMTEDEFESIRRGILKMKECVSKFTVIPL